MPMLIKRTTRDIIGDYIANEQRFDYVEKTSDQIEKADLDLYIKSKETLQMEIRTKMDKVDSFVLETKRKEHLIDAEVDALKNEIDRLKQRRKAVGMFKKFVNDVLLPMVVKEIGTKDGVWETDVARYKLYESFGGVMVNPDEVSSDFKKVEIKESIDKVKARKAAISAHRAGEDMPPGIDIRKIERVRRT